MTTIYINTSDAKEEFSELVNRVAHSKERIVLTRRDKEVAAIVPIEDLSIIQAWKTQNDLEEATEALNEARSKGTVNLDQFRAEMSE